MNKELEILNNKISNLSYLKEVMVKLFNDHYQINIELKQLESFLYNYFVLSRNRIISILCSLFEPHKTGKNTNLSLDYFIKPENELLSIEYTKLKESDSYKKIKMYRHKFLSHYDFKYSMDESKHLSEIGLINKIIYDFTDETIRLAEKINIYNEIYGLDLTIIEHSSDSMIILAERYKTAMEMHIISINMLKKDHPIDYKSFLSEVEQLLEKYGYL